MNESETDKLIRELKEENEKFKQMLMQLATKGEIPKDFDFKALLGKTGGEDGGDGEDNDMQEKDDEDDTDKSLSNATTKDSVMSEESRVHKDELMQQLREKEEQIKAQKEMMEEYERTFKESLPSTHADKKEKIKFDPTFPHLSNINEDPMLTGRINHTFKDHPRITVGKTASDNHPDIKLSALGIYPLHAVFEFEQEEDGAGACYLSPGFVISFLTKRRACPVDCMSTERR